MNPRTLELIRKRAIRAGMRKARKVRHLLGREEILSLRVQIVPVLPRVLAGLAGAGLMAGGITGWPWDQGWVQGILVILGVLCGLFAIFGIRRTLESLGDGLGKGVLEVVVEVVARAAGSVIDL